jgi:hypothetical protein
VLGSACLMGRTFGHNQQLAEAMRERRRQRG